MKFEKTRYLCDKIFYKVLHGFVLRSIERCKKELQKLDRELGIHTENGINIKVPEIKEEGEKTIISLYTYILAKNLKIYVIDQSKLSDLRDGNYMDLSVVALEFTEKEILEFLRSLEVSMREDFYIGVVEYVVGDIREKIKEIRERN